MTAAHPTWTNWNISNFQSILCPMLYFGFAAALNYGVQMHPACKKKYQSQLQQVNFTSNNLLNLINNVFLGLPVFSCLFFSSLTSCFTLIICFLVSLVALLHLLHFLSLWSAPVGFLVYFLELFCWVLVFPCTGLLLDLFCSSSVY